MSVAELKKQAALRAVEFIESGMIVGLGTGSTAVFATSAIGEMLADGRLQNIIAIPTSEATAQEAQRVGIPLTTLSEHPQIDITIDGADEITPELHVTKGLGGALLREKIVETCTNQLIIISDDSKLVAKLGTRSPIPIEVIPFALKPVLSHLQSLGGRPELRQTDGNPYITDENNYIVDCHFAPIDDPHALGTAIRRQPGIVEHGLFLDMATSTIIASSDGITITHK